MVRVVHIITRLDRGGSAQNTLLTCLGLAARYRISLVHGLSLESQIGHGERQAVDKEIEKAVEGGGKIICLPSLVRRIDPVQDLLALFSLWRLMVQEKPAIVHTHTSKAGILGRLAAVMAHVPVIIHTPHGHVFYGHFGPLVSRLFLFVERIMACMTDCVIALTEGERNDYVALSVSAPEKILTIHSGVEVDLYMSTQVHIQEKRRSLGLDSEGLIVGTVGWLLPIKGPMYLLKAMADVWKSYPRTSLVYVGKGDLAKELKEEAFRIGVSDRVKFLGWRDDVPEIMQILDIFVLPSLNEGMGRVLVEAMAAGKPLVASRVGGILDLVKDGQNGFLVEPADVRGLALRIKELLKDEKLRREMGQRGRVMAENFSVEKMVEKIDDLYASVCREP